MKRHWQITWLGITLVFVLLGAACAPQATLPPTPAPTIAPQPTRAPTAAPAAPGPQEQAVAKLVEAARKEGRVNVYSFALTGDIGLAIQRGFQDRYNIRTDIITGRGAEFVERIKTERRTGNVTGDLTDFSLVHATALKSAGATVSTSDLPVFQEKDVWRINPFLSDPEGHLLAYRNQHIGPYMNTNLVKPGEEPKSYKDFLNPRWEGKIVGPDPTFSGGSYQLLIPLLENNKLDLDTVKAIGQRLKFVVGTRQVAEALSRGEFSLGLATTDLDVSSFLNEGAPIRALAMQEGIGVLISPVARIKDGPHPNAAKLFINWLLTKEGQTVYTKAASVAPMRKDVADARHPNMRVDVPISPEDHKMAEKTSKLFQEKYFISLWKK